MRPLTLTSLGFLISSPSWAQEMDTEAPAEEAPAEEATVEEAPPAEEPAPVEETAPEPTSPPVAVEVELANGLVLKGSITTSDALSWSPGSPLVFTPEDGAPTSLAAEQVKAVRTVGTGAEPASAPTPVGPSLPEYTSPGGFAYANVGASRHLYAPSAFSLKKDEGYISQKTVFTSVAYGVTDDLTMLFGTFTFFPPLLSVVGTKYGYQISDRARVAIGGEAFMTGLNGFELLAGVAFGSLTLGDSDRQFTIASGAMVLDEEPAIPLMIAGQVRKSDRVALVTENWLVVETDSLSELTSAGPTAGLASIAVRLIGGRASSRAGNTRNWTSEGQPRITWDFGFIGGFMTFTEFQYSEVDFETGGGEPIENRYIESLGPIPWIDFSWHFGSS